MERGIIFKSGTSLYGLHPKIKMALWKVRRVLLEAGYRTVVTSGWDYTHSQNSFHHYGMAVDIRSNEIPSMEMKREVLRRMATSLGPEYDVLLESPGKSNEHFHIEWEGGRAVREDWLAEVLVGGSK